jgi:hypothetical protein
MKLHLLFGNLLLGTLLTTASHAELKKLAVSDVKAGAGLLNAAEKAGTIISLQRVVEAYDSQLVDRLHGTRKFDIVARSDLKQLAKDGDATGNTFTIPGADYILVTTLDDFQDYTEQLTLPTTGEVLSKRVVRITAVAKIYDATSGRLIESANIKKEIKDAGGQFNSAKNGDLADALLENAVEQSSNAMANRIADVIYPAKVISKLDKVITINRGDGTDIAVGQIWRVWALGAELRDPDTGEVLGRERLPVGTVRITQVDPKTSMADIVEDSGIAIGAMLQVSQ